MVYFQKKPFLQKAYHFVNSHDMWWKILGQVEHRYIHFQAPLATCRDVVIDSNGSLFHVAEEVHPHIRTYSPFQMIFDNLDVPLVNSENVLCSNPYLSWLMPWRSGVLLILRSWWELAYNPARVFTPEPLSVLRIGCVIMGRRREWLKKTYSSPSFPLSGHKMTDKKSGIATINKKNHSAPSVLLV